MQDENRQFIVSLNKARKEGYKNGEIMELRGCPNKIVELKGYKGANGNYEIAIDPNLPDDIEAIFEVNSRPILTFLSRS